MIEPNTTTARPPRTALILTGITCALVATLAFGAFVLSFAALAQGACTIGHHSTRFAWIFPLIIDGGILVFCIARARRAIMGERGHRETALIVGTTAVSALLNMYHDPAALPGWAAIVLPYVYDTSAPIILFFCLEILTGGMLRNLLVRQVQREVEQVQREEIEAGLDTDARRNLVERLIHDQPELSKAGLARELNVHHSTITKDIGWLHDRGRLNGAAERFFGTNTTTTE